MKDDVLVAWILSKGCVTEEIRNEHFKGMKFMAIRQWLENHGLNRHLPIELYSSEAVIVTPKGVMMQVRPCDADMLGLWGGVIEDGETPEEAIIRELYEELKLKVRVEDLKFVENNKHFHRYQNGDEVYFTTFRYELKLDYVPKVHLDFESDGIVFLRPIISHQKAFVEEVMKKYFQN